MEIEVRNGEFCVDARIVGELLDVPSAAVPALMKAKDITCLCEKGADADLGAYRLSFFYKNRRARLIVSADGRLLRRSGVSFGDRPAPRGFHARGGG